MPRTQLVGAPGKMAKMYATEAAQQVVDDAVQLFGAAGVVKGSVVERLYREVRSLRIYEGTTEIHKLIIAKQLRADASTAYRQNGARRYVRPGSPATSRDLARATLRRSR